MNNKNYLYKRNQIKKIVQKINKIFQVLIIKLDSIIHFYKVVIMEIIEIKVKLINIQKQLQKMIQKAPHFTNNKIIYNSKTQIQ